MGNQFLLRSLDSFQRTVNISEYKGKTVAIDGPSILHCGGLAAARDIASYKADDLYLSYFMRLVDLLEKNSVTPIVVFDGLPLPFKQSSVDACRRTRQATLEQGPEFYKEGNFGAAECCCRQSVSISNDTIAVVMEKLMEKKIKCIVAPNEAAAQLAHLAKTGKVDSVVTEDFDPLAFGCPKAISEIDEFGNALETCMDKVTNNETGFFKDYSAEFIRHILILSGSDYLPCIKGVHLGLLLRSYNFNRNTDLVMQNLHLRFKKHIPVDYTQKFRLANLGILHQWVYDMDKKNYVRLHPLPSKFSEQDTELLGKVPTVQDLAMFRVNKVIPESVEESITKEFIAYAESAKENIMPSHSGSSFSTAVPKLLRSLRLPKSLKSAKSSESPTSSSRMRLKQMLSAHNHNALTLPVSVTTSSGGSSAQTSSDLSRAGMASPRKPAQSKTLEAICKRIGVQLPRTSAQVTSELTTPSDNVTDALPSISLSTDSSKSIRPSKYGADSSSSTGKNILKTNSKLSASLPTPYSRGQGSLKSYMKQRCSSLTKNNKGKKVTAKSPLSLPPVSPPSPPPSAEQALVPLTETSASSTVYQADTVDSVYSHQVSPHSTSPKEVDMLSITAVNASDTTTAIDNTSTNACKVLHNMDPVSSGRTTINKNSQYSHLSLPTIRTFNKHSTVPYNRHTRAKPIVSKWAQHENITPSSGNIPSNARTNYLRSNTAAPSNTATVKKQDLSRAFPCSQDTLIKFVASEFAVPVDLMQSSDHILSTHINHATSSTATSSNDNVSVCSQYKSLRHMASKLAQPENITPPLNVIPNKAHNHHSNSSTATSDMHDTIPHHQDTQTKSIIDKESAGPGNTAPLPDELPSKTHINHSMSNAAAYRKRSFDQTEDTPSTTQGNSRKKHIPAPPPPAPKRKHRRH